MSDKEHGAPVLKLHPNQTNQECVARLREMLALAEAGEIMGTVIITVGASGVVGTSFGGYVRTARMLGALEIAKARLTDELLEQSEEV